MRTCLPPLVRSVALGVGTFLLVAVAARPPAHAQTTGGSAFDERAFAALEWRNVGPNRGGRSIAATGTVARPNEYYFGATGGGLWKTVDGGANWFPVGDGQFAAPTAGALGQCEADPDVVYAGFGEVQLRGNIIPGDGVYRTTDGGGTWTHLGLDSSTGQQMVGRVRVHPDDCNVAYAAVLGDPFGPNDTRGVYRTTDGGQNWEQVLFRSDSAGAVDLVIDPSDPDVLYAGFWQVHRKPWKLHSGGPGSGLFKSTDGGDTWSELSSNPGLPETLWGKVGVSVSGADPNRVYAIIESDEGGVFRSDDAGATWERVSEDRNLRQRAFYYTRIYADPLDRDRLYVLNVQFWRSDDGGETWDDIQVPHGDNHDLWIDPTNNRRMIQANDGGANVTLTGGESWTGQLFPTAQMYTITTTSHFPYHICGGQQDNSTICVPSDGDGSYWYQAGGCESGWVQQDLRDPDVYHAGCYGGQLTAFDKEVGQARSVQVWPVNPMGHSAGEIRERFQWTFPIISSPLNPDVVYVASQHLWKSENRGQSWERISPDLTRADPETLGPSGGPITRDQTSVEYYATIFSVAPSRHDANTIWTGSDDGLVHVTRDGGANWSNVTPPDLPAFSRIHFIDPSPHQPGKAYVAATRYRMQDVAPYIYRTDDFGRTWTKIVEGIPHTHHVRGVREDPVREGLLFAGTERGVHVSFDDGESWQSLQREMPVSSIHALEVRDDDLVVASHGRSYWVLDDITPLRQLTEQVVSTKAHLYEPATAIRSLSRPNYGDGRYIGGRSKPLSGLNIYYHLSDDAEEVTIEILDRSGEVIRTFEPPEEEEDGEAVAEDDEGTDEDAGPDGNDGERIVPVPRWGAVPQSHRGGGGGFFGGSGASAPATEAGLQQHRWDLRYPGAETFEGLIMWSAGTRGPVAPPGAYQVRLTVDGESQTRSFRIEKDPRLEGRVTDADLREQFELAMEIRDRTSEANQAVIRVREIKEQIDDRLEKTEDSGIEDVANRLAERLSEAEGEIYQVRLQARQDPLNFPIKLNNKIAALQGQVESADARPTDQQVETFQELSGLLQVELDRIERAVEENLTELNRRLREAGLEPIEEDRPVT